MKDFQEIPKNDWPKHLDNSKLKKVFVNDRFLVQVIGNNGFIRITVNSVEYELIEGKPFWNDGISWDDLQSIKDSIGYKNKWCVECYPPKNEVINVAPMRHLWVLDDKPLFGWHK